ncbi:MAG: PEP/pyruvate-binding domain-containing protein [Marinoscillum sp.]|uniref:PEP/pyruvate-binding domain-containing protein n=3 Tax=Marinoscillum sp. TaxID=2024838 RepID=UPI0032FDE905
MNCTKGFIFLIFFGALIGDTIAQSNKTVTDAAISKMISTYKTDSKGPYKDIRWFCKDGSTVAPQERCPEPGVQRARYRDEVVALGVSNHIFLGQILSATVYEDFWDSEYQGSRMKQYSLEQYLRANDGGWINRRAQFYRGAFQAEDEEAWGLAYLQWLLEDKSRLVGQFFLIRQSAKDIPHTGDNNTAQSVRAISKEISDVYNPFMDLRVKLHGQPEESDIQKVKDFQTTHTAKLKPELQEKFTSLLTQLEIFYQPVAISDFKGLAKKVPNSLPANGTLVDFMEQYSRAKTSRVRCELIATTALALRRQVVNPMKSSARLAVIDASIKMEAMLIRESALWKPETLAELLFKSKTLAQAATGFGYLEIWEWETVASKLTLDQEDEVTLKVLGDYLDHLRRSVEWSAGMFRANYQDVVKRYGAFEPLANGFIDDRVRASCLLQLGSSVSLLGDFFADQAGFSNQLLGIKNQSAARGLNPGYAMGELVVTTQSPEEIEVSGDKIYVFNRPPADLKPVAGIATVTEGNMVSHVQLLARNLGIPNAVLSMENLTALLPYNGEKVFYAVSNKGTVLMKLAAEMTPVEKALFTKKVRNEEKISVPVEMMELDDARILNLRDVNASNSGIICGPKAANLGQLKQLFPDHVVNGIVIPFAIFKQHFDQAMPGQGVSYWEYLKATFEVAEQMSIAGSTDGEVEKYVMGRLEALQAAIRQIKLMPEFEAALNAKFKEAFGVALGKVPVFIRSDTNMEDLKDFTGAGLNLTLFNVLDAQKILQGIKDVWASPYTERSYKWRQKYLLNPENVFPSILIIPSVDADCSGVLITKGVTTGKPDDNTVAFNRGVGGAVEGQASETWLLEADRTILLSPSREPDYTSIPTSGGTLKKHTTFEEPVLSEANLRSLQEMSGALKEKLGEIGMRSPYDVELGFKKDKVWLFQVRPFVENKRAAASEFLRSITPVLAEDQLIPLDTAL